MFYCKTDTLWYENFICDAFNVSRFEDPAGLVDVSISYLAERGEKVYLIKLKSAVCYAMDVYNNKYKEKYGITDADDKMDDYLTSVYKSNNVDTIHKIVCDYSEYMNYLNKRRN